ncbi:MAG: IS110 family transposase, partial [Brevefilum sp.]
MYYCGIDIAKNKHDAVMLSDDGNPIGKPLTITNTAAGFGELISRLQSLEQNVLVGLEA